MQQHSQRVVRVAVGLGKRFSLDQSSLAILTAAALLHDLGKFLVPHAILNKPGQLTWREWDIMQEHPLLSQQLCEALPWLDVALPIIRAHHERLDGSGYPDGLAGSQVPLLAQIVQLADVSDALLSVRAYKPALPLDRVIQILHDEARRDWRDRTLTEECVTTLLETAEGQAMAAPIPRTRSETWHTDLLLRAS